MKTNIKKLALTLVGIGIVSLLAGSMLLMGSTSVRGGAVNIDEQRLYPAGEVRNIEVKTVSSDVNWIIYDGPDIKVHMHGSVNNNPPELVVSDSRDYLQISVQHKPFVGIHYGRVVLDIYVPRGINLARASFETTSGDVDIPEIVAEDFEISTVSGDLTLRSVTTMTSSFRSTSGDIELTDFVGELDFRSVSGNLDAELTQFTGDIDLSNTSGDIRLDLPDGSAFALQAESVSGDITCNFPITISGGRGKHDLSGIVGHGGPQIKSKTISGDLKIF